MPKDKGYAMKKAGKMSAPKMGKSMKLPVQAPDLKKQVVRMSAK